jgi:hypothetical protein
MSWEQLSIESVVVVIEAGGDTIIKVSACSWVAWLHGSYSSLGVLVTLAI